MLHWLYTQSGRFPKARAFSTACLPPLQAQRHSALGSSSCLSPVEILLLQTTCLIITMSCAHTQRHLYQLPPQHTNIQKHLPERGKRQENQLKRSQGLILLTVSEASVHGHLAPWLWVCESVVTLSITELVMAETVSLKTEEGAGCQYPLQACPKDMTSSHSALFPKSSPSPNSAWGKWQRLGHMDTWGTFRFKP